MFTGIANRGGYLMPIPSDYFWNQRAPGQVVTPSWVDYYDTKYLIGPDMLKEPQPNAYQHYGTSSIQEGITLFEHSGTRGASKTFKNNNNDLNKYGWSDKASSIFCGSGRWWAFADTHYGGRKYGPFIRTGTRGGTYSTSAFGNDKISSLMKQFSQSTYNSRLTTLQNTVRAAVEGQGKEYTPAMSSYVASRVKKIWETANADQAVLMAWNSGDMAGLSGWLYNEAIKRHPLASLTAKLPSFSGDGGKLGIALLATVGILALLIPGILIIRKRQKAAAED